LLLDEVKSDFKNMPSVVEKLRNLIAFIDNQNEDRYFYCLGGRDLVVSLINEQFAFETLSI
jgi:hypothetical protein